MDDTIIETPLFDPNMDSYKPFFDHEWAKQTFELVKDSVLESPVNSLMVAWRSTNGAHLLPWLMADSLRGYAKGEHLGNIEYRTSYSDQLVKHLVEKIASRMHPKLKYDQRASLSRIVGQIEKEAFHDMKAARSQVELDISEYWRFLTESREFPFCIMGTQIINYCSLFFAYEDFIAGFIRVKNPKYTSTHKDTTAQLTIHYGAVLGGYCWADAEIDVARLVRNALVHNSGRCEPAIEKHPTRFLDVTEIANPELRGHKFNIVSGKVQIAPDNTRHLFSILKLRVTRIAEAIK